MNMNDVLYEAKVVQDRPRVKVASKTPLLIAIICFLLGIVKGQVLLLLIGGIAAAVFAILRDNGKLDWSRAQYVGTLRRVALTEQGVQIERLRGVEGRRQIESQIIPISRITGIEVRSPVVVCISTEAETVELNGVLDAAAFADAVKRNVQEFWFSDASANTQDEDKMNLQNAMEHMLRTGAITQAQFDTANDPDRPLPPQPAVDADTFHALEYQLQTGMITREQFDAMAYSQQAPAPQQDPLDLLAPVNMPDTPDADEQNALAYQQRMQQFGAMMPPDAQERMQL